MPTVTEANMIYHPDQDYHVDIPQPLEIDAGENSYLESIMTLFAVIMAIIILNYVFKKIVQYMRSYNLCCSKPVEQEAFVTRLILLFTNGKEQVALHLQDIPYPENSISAVRKPNLEGHGKFGKKCFPFFERYINLKYDKDLEFNVEGVTHYVPMVTRTYVPIPLRRTLYNMLVDSKKLPVKTMLVMQETDNSTSINRRYENLKENSVMCVTEEAAASISKYNVPNNRPIAHTSKKPNLTSISNERIYTEVPVYPDDE
jgi:hypothetical protein